MIGVLIASGFIFLLVLGLVFFTIKRGYAYKHTIDEIPNQQIDLDEKKKTHQP